MKKSVIKDIKIEDLRLWEKNPRWYSSQTVSKSIKELEKWSDDNYFDTENLIFKRIFEIDEDLDEMKNLAESIDEYFNNSKELIVVVEINDKFVVLEGNRRALVLRSFSNEKTYENVIKFLEDKSKDTLNKDTLNKETLDEIIKIFKNNKQNLKNETVPVSIYHLSELEDEVALKHLVESLFSRNNNSQGRYPWKRYIVLENAYNEFSEKYNSLIKEEENKNLEVKKIVSKTLKEMKKTRVRSKMRQEVEKYIWVKFLIFLKNYDLNDDKDEIKLEKINRLSALENSKSLKSFSQKPITLNKFFLENNFSLNIESYIEESKEFNIENKQVFINLIKKSSLMEKSKLNLDYFLELSKYLFEWKEKRFYSTSGWGSIKKKNFPITEIYKIFKEEPNKKTIKYWVEEVVSSELDTVIEKNKLYFEKNPTEEKLLRLLMKYKEWAKLIKSESLDEKEISNKLILWKEYFKEYDKFKKDSDFNPKEIMKLNISIWRKFIDIFKIKELKKYLDELIVDNVYFNSNWPLLKLSAVSRSFKEIFIFYLLTTNIDLFDEIKEEKKNENDRLNFLEFSRGVMLSSEKNDWFSKTFLNIYLGKGGYSDEKLEISNDEKIEFKKFKKMEFKNLKKNEIKKLEKIENKKYKKNKKNKVIKLVNEQILSIFDEHINLIENELSMNMNRLIHQFTLLALKGQVSFKLNNKDNEQILISKAGSLSFVDDGKIKGEFNNGKSFELFIEKIEGGYGYSYSKIEIEGQKIDVNNNEQILSIVPRVKIIDSSNSLNSNNVLTFDLNTILNLSIIESAELISYVIKKLEEYMETK